MYRYIYMQTSLRTRSRARRTKNKAGFITKKKFLKFIERYVGITERIRGLLVRVRLDIKESLRLLDGNLC